MPYSDIHKRKFSKNLAVLGLIGAFCALFFAITVTRISGNKELAAALSPATQTIEPNINVQTP